MSNKSTFQFALENERAYLKFLSSTITVSRPGSPALLKVANSLAKTKKYLSATLEASNPSFEELTELAELFDLIQSLEETLNIKKP